MATPNQSEDAPNTSRRKMVVISALVVLLLLVVGYSLFQQGSSSEPNGPAIRDNVAHNGPNDFEAQKSQPERMVRHMPEIGGLEVRGVTTDTGPVRAGPSIFVKVEVDGASADTPPEWQIVIVPSAVDTNTKPLAFSGSGPWQGRLAVPEASVVDVFIHAPGFVSHDAYNIVSDDAEVVLKLEAYAKIAFLVTQEDLLRFPNIRVIARPRQLDKAWSFEMRRRAHRSGGLVPALDSDGIARVEVHSSPTEMAGVFPNTVLGLLVVSDDSVEQTITIESIAAGATREVELKLVKGIWITGRVVDLDSSFEVAGLKLHLARPATAVPGVHVTGTSSSFMQEQSALSDADGSFRIGPVGLGDKLLRIRHPDEKFDFTLAFSLDEEVEYDLGDIAIPSGRMELDVSAVREVYPEAKLLKYLASRMRAGKSGVMNRQYQYSTRGLISGEIPAADHSTTIFGLVPQAMLEISISIPGRGVIAQAKRIIVLERGTTLVRFEPPERIEEIPARRIQVKVSGVIRPKGSQALCYTLAISPDVRLVRGMHPASANNASVFKDNTTMFHSINAREKILFVACDGFRCGKIEVAADVAMVTIPLDRDAASGSLRVFDQVSGEPIVGASVGVFWRYTDAILGRFGGAGAPVIEVKTTDQGRAALTALFPDEFIAIRVDAEGYKSIWQSVSLAEIETGFAQLQMEPAHR